jgi:hypothetical protein
MSDSFKDYPSMTTEEEISSYVETSVLSAENKLSSGWNDAFQKGIVGFASVALLLKLSVAYRHDTWITAGRGSTCSSCGVA